MQEAADVEDDSLAKPKEPNLENFEENLKHPNSEKKILDGGYGWIVTFASFMCHFIADGISFTFGVIYSDLLSAFGASKSATSFVGSLFVGVPLLCGPIAGLYVNKYGCRSAAILGALITSLGMLLSSFANSIGMQCFTYGVVAGFGLAFVYVPASIIPSFWFEKRRSLATGIAVSGSGLGTYAVAPLIEFLIDEYGWRGTLLIFSGITLNFMVFGALFRDPPTRVVPTDMKISKRLAPSTSLGNLSSLASCQSFRSLNTEVRSARSNSLDGDPLPRSPRHKTLHHSIDALANKNEFEELVEVHNPEEQNLKEQSAPQLRPQQCQSLQIAYMYRSNRSLLRLSRYDLLSAVSTHNRQRTISSCPELSLASSESQDSLHLKQTRMKRFTKKIKNLAIEMCDLRLFAVPVYLLFFISNFTLAYAYDLPYIYLPDYAIEQNIDKSSFLISIIGIVNTFGQVIYGYLGDKKAINTMVLFGVSIFLCGVLISLIPIMHTYAALATFSALFGLFISASFALETIVLVKILSLEQLTKAYSLLMFGQGVASLIGPPIGGKLYLQKRREFGQNIQLTVLRIF